MKPWIAQPATLLAALLAPLPAQPGDLDSARTFAAGLYAAYQHGEPDFRGPQANATFAPRLLGLIRHDQAAASPGDVGALDGDPICDCQDDGGMKTLRIQIAQPASGRAAATVTLRFPDGVRTLRLDLVSQGGGWRIADIHTKDMPSLVDLLENSARAAAGKREPHDRNQAGRFADEQPQGDRRAAWRKIIAYCALTALGRASVREAVQLA